MNDTLMTALALIPALVLAIVFHEVAHGWTALALGDPTAKERRRLSLNPVRHVDPMGTIFVPGIMWLTTGMAFGWAKPVPVNKFRLNNPRYGMMAVAAAGPGSNLVLAVLGAIVLGLLLAGLAVPGAGGQAIRMALYESIVNPSSLASYVLLSVYYFIILNVFLALFNLLPIPPFDGSHIVEGLLPPDAARQYNKLRPFGFPLLFLLLLVIPYFFPGLGIIEKVVLPPVQWLQERYLNLALAVAGG